MQDDVNQKVFTFPSNARVPGKNPHWPSELSVKRSLKPACGMTVIVPPPPPPGGGAVATTVTVTVAVCVALPPTPVTVRVNVLPTVADALAEIVNVEVPLPGAAMLSGAGVAVILAGGLETDSAIPELKFPIFAVVMVVVAKLPFTTDTLVGEAEMVKSPDGVMV